MRMNTRAAGGIVWKLILSFNQSFNCVARDPGFNPGCNPGFIKVADKNVHPPHIFVTLSLRHLGTQAIIMEILHFVQNDTVIIRMKPELIFPLFQQIPRYHQPLYLVCPLEDAGDAGVAIEALEGKVGHIAHPAVDLNRVVHRLA